MQPEQYETHAVWTTLTNIQGLLAEDLKPWDDGARYEVRRLHAVAEFLDALRESDPVLIEPPALQELHGHVQSLYNALAQYVNDPDAQRAHLPTATSHIPGILNVGRSHFLFVVPDEAGRAVKGAATRYRNSLDSEADRYKKQIDALTVELDEAKATRAQDHEAAAQRLEELNQTIQSRGTDIEALRVTLQGQIDEQRTAFEGDSQSRVASFKNALESHSKAEAARVEAANTAEEQRLFELMEAEEDRLRTLAESDALVRKEREDQAGELIAALEEYRNQAKTLADTTGRHAVTGEYGSWAGRQARAALIWTVTAVVIGLGTVGVLLYAVGSAGDDTIQFTLYKSSISLIGLIVAGYAARQASEHRREERTAKRLALDLAALPPFLENVADAEPLRQAVAMRVFAPEGEKGAQDDGGRIRIKGRSMTLAEIIELVVANRGGG